MNRVNYVRFGTYYVMQLSNIEQIYSGAREELQKMEHLSIETTWPFAIQMMGQENQIL